MSRVTFGVGMAVFVTLWLMVAMPTFAAGHQPRYCRHPDIDGPIKYEAAMSRWWPVFELRFWDGFPTCEELHGDGWRADGISGSL